MEICMAIACGKRRREFIGRRFEAIAVLPRGK
jgi:hypothetical protein